MNNILSNVNQRTFIWNKNDDFGAHRNGTSFIFDDQVIAFNPSTSTSKTVYSHTIISCFDFMNPMIEEICGVFNPIIATELSNYEMS